LIRGNDVSLAGDNNDLSNGRSGVCWIVGRWGRCRPIDRTVDQEAGDELYDIVCSDIGKRWRKDIELHGNGKECGPA
jgi:hypothetical protein